MNRKWILRSFAIKVGNSIATDPFIPSFEDGKCFFMDANGEKEFIDDYEKGKPIFPLVEKISVRPEDFPLFTEKQTTSYGNMVVGACIFGWALENKVPFHNPQKPYSIGDLDDIVSKAIKDKVIDIEPHYKNYIKALDFCTVFTDFITPVGHEEMFTTNDKVTKVRDKLIKENEGRLHVPAVAAKVEEGVNKAIREELKNSPAMGFLGTSKKLINTVMKKQHYLQGIGTDTKDPSRVAFIGTSLNEGWKKEDMPGMINGIRSGSFSRGQNTALGGLATKQIQRALQNVRIGSDDCGTKVGIPIRCHKGNIKRLEGFYDSKSGKVIKPEIGKEYIIRNPGTCKEPNGNVCKKCLGDRVANSGNALGALAITFTGGLLNVFLSAFHSVDLTLQKLDFEERLK